MVIVLLLKVDTLDLHPFFPVSLNSKNENYNSKFIIRDYFDWSTKLTECNFQSIQIVAEISIVLGVNATRMIIMSYIIF